MRTSKDEEVKDGNNVKGDQVKGDQVKGVEHKDQMLWERHLTTTEAARAEARCIDPQSAAPLLASYERLVEGWSNQGSLWCDLAKHWKDVAMIMIAQNADKIGTGTG